MNEDIINKLQNNFRNLSDSKGFVSQLRKEVLQRNISLGSHTLSIIEDFSYESEYISILKQEILLLTEQIKSTRQSVKKSLMKQWYWVSFDKGAFPDIPEFSDPNGQRAYMEFCLRKDLIELKQALLRHQAKFNRLRLTLLRLLVQLIKNGKKTFRVLYQQIWLRGKRKDPIKSKTNDCFDFSFIIPTNLALSRRIPTAKPNSPAYL